MPPPSYQHEKALIDYLAELRLQGWKTIRLNNKSPDGIAVKDGKVVAIEILIKGKDGQYRATDTSKRDDYSMFDGVLIRKIKQSDNAIIKTIEHENKIYAEARKKKDEEKIDKEWNKWDSIQKKN